MLRRYLVALVGMLVGEGAVAGAFLALGYDPDLYVLGACGMGLAAILMTQGERLGLVPSADEANKPPSILPDEKDRRR